MGRLESSAVSKKRARQQRRLARGDGDAAREGDATALDGHASAAVPSEKRVRRDSVMPSRRAAPLSDDEDDDAGGGGDHEEGADAAATMELPLSLGELVAQEESGGAPGGGGGGAAAAADCSSDSAGAATVALPESLGDLVTQELCGGPPSDAVSILPPQRAPGGDATGSDQGPRAPAVRRLPRPPPGNKGAPAVAALLPPQQNVQPASVTPMQPPVVPPPPPQHALGLSLSPAPPSLASRRGLGSSQAGTAHANNAELPLQQRRVTLGVFSFSTQQQPSHQIARNSRVPVALTALGSVPEASPPHDTSDVAPLGGTATFATHSDGADDTVSSMAMAHLQSMLGSSMNESREGPAARAGAPAAASAPSPAFHNAVARNETAASEALRFQPPASSAGLAAEPQAFGHGPSAEAEDMDMSSMSLPDLQLRANAACGHQESQMAAAERSEVVAASPIDTGGSWKPRRAATPARRVDSSDESSASGLGLADASAIELSGSIVYSLPQGPEQLLRREDDGRLQHASSIDSRLMLASPGDALAQSSAANDGDVTTALPASLAALAREEAGHLFANAPDSSHVVSMMSPQTPPYEVQPMHRAERSRGTPIRALLDRVSTLNRQQQEGHHALIDGDEDMTAALVSGLGALIAQEGLAESGGATLLAAVTDEAAVDVSEAAAEAAVLSGLGVTPNRALQKADRAASAIALVEAVAAADSLEREIAEAEAARAEPVASAVPAALPRSARDFMTQLSAAAAAAVSQQPLLPLQASLQRTTDTALGLPHPGPIATHANVQLTAPPAPSAVQMLAYQWLPSIPTTQEAATQPFSSGDDDVLDEEMPPAPIAPAAAPTPMRDRVLRAVARTASRPGPKADLITAPTALAAAAWAMPQLPSFGVLGGPSVRAAATSAPPPSGSSPYRILTLLDLCTAVGVPTASDPTFGCAPSIDFCDAAPTPFAGAATALFTSVFSCPTEAMQTWVARALEDDGASLTALLSAPLFAPGARPPFAVKAVQDALALLRQQQRRDAPPPLPSLIADAQELLFRVQGLHGGLATGVEATYLTWRAQALDSLGKELAAAVTRLEVRGGINECCGWGR